MDSFINWELISNPINWVIVGLMLAIAVFGLNIVMSPGKSIMTATGSAGL